MQRRKFIKNISLLLGGLIATTANPFTAFALQKNKVRGRVLHKGQPLNAVVVSDGYTVLCTDREGRFEFDLHADADTVFISTPAGFAFQHEKGVARHYQPVRKLKKKDEIIFELVKLEQDDQEHQFIIWADPQVKNKKDVQKMMEESVPDVQKLVAAAGAGTLIHGITVGDIVWDELEYFEDYNKAVEKMGIPFFQVLGNHDMDFRKGGDETSDDTFIDVYGPTYYSFNRGKVHYVVLDDVRYLGRERDYDGFITEHQLNWLKKDLSFVPKENLVVLCLHIPVHSGVKNNTDLYQILGDRQVHIMSGHTHYHLNNIQNNIYEHNHGTVCGAWWTGPICVDGTPNGYGVYKVKGTELSWHYQATGQKADYQMKIHVSDLDAARKQVLVNIWNHDPAWKQEYFVDGVSKGSLPQIEGFDPDAFRTMFGPDLPKPRGFAEPHKTRHLFSANIPATAKEIKVVATDRFGKTFTEIKTLGS
jgi:hypothetical protein